MMKHLSLFVIAICLPFILWAVCGILPTFDDYTTLQSPWWVRIADPGYFFPDSVRRPFDAMLGYIVGWQPKLFPELNHVLIILGHTASAFLVHALCQKLKLGMLAANIASLFFFFSPATLGATLACDGFNQTFAQMWGLLALWTYLSALHSSRPKHLWLICIVMAVMSKENGLAWAVVPPLAAYAFCLIDRRRAMLDIGKGMLVAIIYIGTFATLAITGVLEYPDEYFETSLLSHLKDFVQLMAYTWVPLDYMSAVYPPTRNWTVVFITLLMSLPFLVIMFGKWRLLKGRTLPILFICFFILVSPHLLTVVSIMHNYAALSIAAIIMAYVVSHVDSVPIQRNIKPWLCSVTSITVIAFSFFMASALFTDVRHYIAAKESGLLGRQLAMQAINKADRPLEHAMVISIDNSYEPRYSNFCVRPVDAFAWGLSVCYYTNYEWNTKISEISFEQYEPQQIMALADSALQAGNDAVWIVGHKGDVLTVISNDDN